jgi:hypothetical protein
MLNEKNWSRVYRSHVIMAFPSFNVESNSWVPQADITWCNGATRESEFVRFTRRTKTEVQAVRAALERSATWIDRRAPKFDPRKQVRR